MLFFFFQFITELNFWQILIWEKVQVQAKKVLAPIPIPRLALGFGCRYRNQLKKNFKRDNFCNRLGTQTSLTKLVLKSSVLKQSLPNSQHKNLQTSQYEAYIEATQNFFMYVTIFVPDWAQKTSLAKLVLKSSVLKQCLPNSQHKFLQTSQYEAYIDPAQNFIRYVPFS